MAVFNSDQYVSYINQVPKVELRPSDLAGRVRLARFSYTAPGSGQPSAGDTLNLTVIPWNARVLATFIVSDAQATGAILQFGDGTTATKYGSSTALTSASTQWIGAPKAIGAADLGTTEPTTASGNSLITPNVIPFVATWNTAGAAASAVLWGFVLFVVD